ncbi:hypothetical protein TNCV_1857401 [Trichonephila clavipes]|nr:hypothetical protein TNCV_1857401 [Trichonephila clavipes]
MDNDGVQKLLDSHTIRNLQLMSSYMYEQEQDIEELESVHPVQSEDRMTVGNLIMCSNTSTFATPTLYVIFKSRRFVLPITETQAESVPDPNEIDNLIEEGKKLSNKIKR